MDKMYAVYVTRVYNVLAENKDAAIDKVLASDMEPDETMDVEAYEVGK